jgi:CHAT domain-containing protein
MRARSLLDVLDRSRPVLDAKHPAVEKRREVLGTIANVQRMLMDPTVSDDKRQGFLLELEQHERDEQEWQRQVDLAFPHHRLAAPEFATLSALQSSLSESEAFLSFQVGLWETYEGDDGGGSWLIAVTKDRTTVHRLPDRTRLVNVVPVFIGLLKANEGRERAAAVRLYDELLAAAVAALPPRTTRLIIAADGALHHLPFESLRASITAPPFGAKFEIVYVPSATLWRHWRAAARASNARGVLTFADPELEGSVGTDEGRNAVLLTGLRLGHLPHAREESAAIDHYIAGTRALVGAAASEHALKSVDLTAYDVLHFATHAVSDESHPERSAVLLAAGDAKEDGLLQAREIEALDLAGRIIVLSACQTATGVIQSGEGVLSLARAFFEAGAHAVVGSRWPLRDADAAQLFQTFYRELAKGASLSEALKSAQDEARIGGRPAAAWAGLVLLGNGDLRPFLGAEAPRRGVARYFTASAVLALLATVVTLTAYWRRRR